MVRYDFALLIFALSAVAYVTAQSEALSHERCRKNEVWNPCGNACDIEPTCPGRGPPRIVGRRLPCPTVCESKCTCKHGLVRGPDGKCIEREHCPVPIKCPINQVWNPCGNACEERCQPDGRSCATVCVAKCSCARGYVIGPNGDCIAKDKCPKQKHCPEGQFWNECGSYCERRCDDDPANPKMCPAVCVKKCSCKDGRLLNKEGKCVLKKDCKKHG